jgi:predicted ArsR family transcriptional regulator
VTAVADTATAQQVHRALSSPVRVRLLDLLRGEPADARDLADRLSLHVNTVRAHLALLEDAGLVGSEAVTRDGPGRPRLVYRATDEAATAPDESGYRFLAEILASYVTATAPDPSAAAEGAGSAWGRYLVDRPAPFRDVAPDDAIAEIVRILDEVGFAPELESDDPRHPRLLLHRCPFLDVAKEHQDVVCSVHLGLMRGALDELGVAVSARDLRPFVTPDLCVTELEVGT